MSCCLTCAGLLFLIIVIYKVLDRLIRLPKLGSLSSRYILVTGCDTGFGNEISKRLDNMGCNVIAGCLTEKGETELIKQCSNRLKTVSLNVADHKSVLNAYEEVKKILPQGSGLWGVLNNAGIAGKVGPVDWLNLKDYDEVFAVNLLGLVDVTVTFLPLVKKARGRVVNTASVFGRYSLAGSVPYCISKYGVEAFSDALRRQLGDFRVSVHLIEPGFHKTNITNTAGIEASFRKSWAQASDEVKAVYGEEYVEQSVKNSIQIFVNGIVSERIFDVVDAYEHALIGMFPRARYVVGNDAKYLWLVLQALPEWLGDKILGVLARDRAIPSAVKQG